MTALNYHDNQPIPGKLYATNKVMLRHLGEIVFDVVDSRGNFTGEYDVQAPDIFMCVVNAEVVYRSGLSNKGFNFLCGDKKIHIDASELDLIEEIT